MEKNGNVVGILLAAGYSKRMGENKLLIKLCSKTVLEYSYIALCASCVDKIIIATSEDTLSEAEKVSRGSEKETIIVSGGTVRSQSVYNALAKCEQGTEIVVIHDAARCLVTPTIINEAVSFAMKNGSGIATKRMYDTLRSKKSFETIDREDTIAMQTPQAFSFGRIRWAYEKATGYIGLLATDDCAIYQHAGFSPYFFESASINDKLTYPGDVEVFQAVIEKRCKEASECSE